jgi:hypothetical protein
MISTILRNNTVEEWDYLNIDQELLQSRYEWINIYLPQVELNFPWAVRNDILSLFFLCISYESKSDVLSLLENQMHLSLNDTHKALINFICYLGSHKRGNLDLVIEKSDNCSLLHFIYETLERALLWYRPDHSWESDFYYILEVSKKRIEQSDLEDFVLDESLEVIGVEFNSTVEHTHVFYKFQDLCLQLRTGSISYDIKTLAIQAHDALIQSIRLRLEFNISSLNEIRFDEKVDSIIAKETQWCVSRLTKQ